MKERTRSYFKIHISLDDDALSGDDCGVEIARILGEVQDHVQNIYRADLESHDMTLYDINGNVCGWASASIDDEDEEGEDE